MSKEYFRDYLKKLNKVDDVKPTTQPKVSTTTSEKTTKTDEVTLELNKVERRVDSPKNVVAPILNKNIDLLAQTIEEETKTKINFKDALYPAKFIGNEIVTKIRVFNLATSIHNKTQKALNYYYIAPFLSKAAFTQLKQKLAATDFKSSRKYAPKHIKYNVLDNQAAYVLASYVLYSLLY